MERTIKLCAVREHITCGLCGGYLIDATTIVECLHTFCRSCLVKHLRECNFCPSCKIVLHQSHPMNYISTDRTLQDIVYKLVPDLQEREIQRQKEFEVAMFMYRTGEQQNIHNNSQKNISSPKPKVETYADTSTSKEDYHRNDEQTAICMECYRSSNGKYLLKPLTRKYLKLSSQATVQHLKKFIAKKLALDNHTDVDILCNDEILGKDHTIKFIMVTRWRCKDSPLLLHYRPSLKLLY
ncbi:polycomb group RING finger protein 3-like [Actinia tenebrosa]|uniref:Polycomb group RING finger protein 3-like n=1 Tax=Actinia tenebrosa TaxID=6105 RepID=A0A6P8I556_ACTTE|nr:polycomb group RING finger protein 3-like [Actinia tenebrosa]